MQYRYERLWYKIHMYCKNFYSYVLKICSLHDLRSNCSIFRAALNLERFLNYEICPFSSPRKSSQTHCGLNVSTILTQSYLKKRINICYKYCLQSAKKNNQYICSYKLDVFNGIVHNLSPVACHVGCQMSLQQGNLIQKKYVLKVDQYRLMKPRALDQILPLEKIDPLKII